MEIFCRCQRTCEGYGKFSTYRGFLCENALPAPSHCSRERDSFDFALGRMLRLRLISEILAQDDVFPFIQYSSR
jgi:hypothetical protein